MAWKTLGEAMMDAIAQGMIDGDGAAATAPVSRKLAKSAASTKPAASYREVSNEAAKKATLPTIGRHRRAGETPHLEERSPVPAARRCMLTVIEGGRNLAGRSDEVPAYSAAREMRGDGRACLRLVVSR